jgi:hypothetical protein
VPGISIIGLQWGDEAKGKLVDLLTEGQDFVVRYQGGANAGHTVVVGDQVYKLHHIPSGIIHAGVVNIVAPGVVIHPQTILREIDSLTQRNLQLAGRLLLSDRAQLLHQHPPGWPRLPSCDCGTRRRPSAHLQHCAKIAQICSVVAISCEIHTRLVWLAV